ncbi:hypothetical protein N658DRAFT_146095 [Parathielavia hyrcaniae]|uniref:Uncharacterized protein n=1 Tax=Parathielavia hyrcaniae TaxID=113614 RepID=A0AAN6Q0J3_9PEZI|nr:hypothetical protein N658DRAFT_146095 [Parathielavia hyrcaniae]
MTRLDWSSLLPPSAATPVLPTESLPHIQAVSLPGHHLPRSPLQSRLLIAPVFVDLRSRPSLALTCQDDTSERQAGQEGARVACCPVLELVELSQVPSSPWTVTNLPHWCCFHRLSQLETRREHDTFTGCFRQMLNHSLWLAPG